MLTSKACSAAGIKAKRVSNLKTRLFKAHNADISKHCIWLSYPMCACRYAELNGDTRSFTPEEEDLFDRSAEFAYASFRDKAAESRRMPIEELQKHAQGRVWSGKRALEIGLIDGLGGVERAISIAKQEAGIGKPALSWHLVVLPLRV